MLAAALTGSAAGMLPALQVSGEEAASEETGLKETGGAEALSADAGAGKEKAPADTASKMDLDQFTDYLDTLPLDQVDATLDKLDKETIMDYAHTILTVFRSEEFQHLLDYREVQELIKTVIQRSADFVRENGELTAKILKTLGIRENYVRILMKVVESGLALDEDIQNSLSEQEKDWLVSFVQEILTNESTKELLRGTLNDFKYMDNTEGKADTVTEGSRERNNQEN